MLSFWDVHMAIPKVSPEIVDRDNAVADTPARNHRVNPGFEAGLRNNFASGAVFTARDSRKPHPALVFMNGELQRRADCLLRCECVTQTGIHQDFRKRQRS